MTKLRLNFLLYVTLILMSTGCDASDPAPTAKSTQSSPHNVSMEQIRAALASPDEKSFQTPLGTVLIKRGGGDTKVPGQIFLNGELIYTARLTGFDKERDGPFSLSLNPGASNNDRKKPGYHVLQAVIEERDISCQYLVLDFTGPNVWVSERFPKRAAKSTGCFEMTWTEWTKGIGIFYFGDEDYLWDKEGYHGWTAAYNPKFKRILEPVDAPAPPKYCSFIPKPSNPAFREAGMPKCGDK